MTADLSTPAPAASGRRIFECPECGRYQALGALMPGSTAKCSRCGGTLLSIPENSLQRSLALVLTGLILLAIAISAPFMSLSIQGRFQQADLITGAVALWDQGLWQLAIVVLLTTVVAPLLTLGALCYVLVGLRLPRPPSDLPMVFRWLEFLHPWSMIEVYLLGVFVAYVKLVAFASVGVGAACYALGFLMLIMVAIDFELSPELVWLEMQRRGLAKAPALGGGALLLCETCGLTAPVGERGSACPRCGATRHLRKPNSVTRTWALVITAMILYVPANIYPVMTVVMFGQGAPNTILGGVKELLDSGMWPLALLVFFASITVPALKILGLILLLLTTQQGSRWRLRDRTVLYRIVESVGRWSMIDIFMLSILAGLVQLGAIATIEPGVGAISFCAVVIITMFAAASFDPRLMWDSAGANR
jgi:paraquat-inducible protein A